MNRRIALKSLVVAGILFISYVIGSRILPESGTKPKACVWQGLRYSSGALVLDTYGATLKCVAGQWRPPG